MSKDKNSQFFVNYMDKNGKLKHSLENLKKYAQQLKEHSDEIRDEALKGSTTIFGQQIISVGDLDRITETLEFNDSNLMEVIDEIIKAIEEENKEVHEHLGKLKINTAEITERLDKILISYNQKKQRERVTLSNLLGIVMKTGYNIIGVIEEEDKDLAENYITQFKGLKNALDNKSGNELIFAHFKSMIEFLGKAQKGGKISAISNNKEIVKNNAKQFITNFKTHNHGKIITIGFDDLKLEDKTFAQIDGDDKKDKVAKFMRTHLKSLFANIENSDNNDYDFDTLIKVKEDINELEETYNKKYEDLLTEINKYAGKNDRYKQFIEISTHSLGKLLTIKYELNTAGTTFEDFEKSNEYKDKKHLDSMIKAIRKIIAHEHNLKAYLKLQQKENTKLANKLDLGESLESSSSDGNVQEGKQLIKGIKSWVPRCLKNNKFFDDINTDTLDYNNCHNLLKYIFGESKINDDIAPKLKSIAYFIKTDTGIEIDKDLLKNFTKHVNKLFDDSNLQNNLDFWKTFFWTYLFKIVDME